MYRVKVSLRNNGSLETLTETAEEAHAWLIKTASLNYPNVTGWGAEKLTEAQVRDWRARNGGNNEQSR